MITAFFVIALIGIGCGLWGEFSEQRRLGTMARQVKAGGKKA